jgi:hypothetical protein
MLKNLYKTWRILAPNEVTFWDNGEAITLEKNQPPCHTWVTVKPWLDVFACPFKFWACPDCDRSLVDWSGDIATCRNCGKNNQEAIA